MDELDSSVVADELLADISAETLQELLGTVRNEDAPVRSWGLASLDSCLAMVNHSGRPLNPGDIIEVQGPAGSGKTHLVYCSLISCLMPPQDDGIDLGGWGKAALVFDTDGCFDLARLQELLVYKLVQLISEQDARSSREVVADRARIIAIRFLSNVHIYRPVSSLQLAATLLNLSCAYALESQLKDVEIGLLVIESLSTFYWEDRFTVEQLRSASTDPEVPITNPIEYVLDALRQIRRTIQPVVIVTNWGLNPAGHHSSLFRQHLHPNLDVASQESAAAPSEPLDAIQQDHIESISQVDHETVAVNPSSRTEDDVASLRVLTHHITLSPIQLPQIPQSMSLEEAYSEDRPLRQRILETREFRGIIRTSGSNKRGTFSFLIGENGMIGNQQI
ncbi:hypothetical protein K474DRAFT_295278 [Panus rudis PR-1116 ss-1]|nr:hypothetical protein K474DRAFT_295278 [Panus rudis PR-1116 ss-1]